MSSLVHSLSHSMCKCQGKATWRHSEKATICKPERKPSPELDQAGGLILDLPDSSTVRNKVLLLMNYRVCESLLKQPQQTKQKVVVQCLGHDLKAQEHSYFFSC